MLGTDLLRPWDLLFLVVVMWSLGGRRPSEGPSLHCDAWNLSINWRGAEDVALPQLLWAISQLGFAADEIGFSLFGLRSPGSGKEEKE